MKAILYTHYGSPDVLQLKEVEKPIPKDNELLIKVYAVEVTKTDCEMRSFHFSVKWFWLPLRIALGIRKPKRQILGGYFSGEVENIGKDVTKYSKGDQVFGSTQLRLGAYGEYLCLPENYTIGPKPTNISYADAAAVPLGGFNALHFMRKAKIQKGDKILINGAGGSIGLFAVQIAKVMGAEVTAVDSGIKENLLRQIGADYVIDYIKEDFLQQGQSYEVIFDMIPGSSYSKCVKILKPKGRYLLGNPTFAKMMRAIITTLLTDKRVIFTFAGEKEEELVALKEMIEQGKIKPVLDKIYTMEQAAEAHKRVETEQRLGCIVIAIGNE